jgi:hypothetical protein
VPEDIISKYKGVFKTFNMDAQIKAWLKQDFDFEIKYMEDIYEAKEHIKRKYAELYPDVFLANECDRQGWTRVWLADKINKLMEVGQ